MSLPHFVPNLAVFSPEKQERLAFSYNDFLDLGNEDCMVSGLLGGLQMALQVS